MNRRRLNIHGEKISFNVSDDTSSACYKVLKLGVNIVKQKRHTQVTVLHDNGKLKKGRYSEIFGLATVTFPYWTTTCFAFSI